MATTAAVLNVLVKTDTARATSQLRQFDSGLNKTATSGRNAVKQTDTLQRSTRRAAPALATAAKAAIGLGAAYVGLRAAREAVTATTDLAKSTLTLKKGFGLTIATASELGAVLKARGADATSTGMAFNTLSRQVEAAKDGSETAAKAFRNLGVSQNELKKSSPDELLFQISDGMEKLGKGTERTAATSVLFGRGWKTLGPVLREGSDSLKEQLDLANKYGAAFGGKSIKSMQDLIQTERELKIAQLGLQVQFTEKIAPALIKVGLTIAGVVNWFDKLFRSTNKMGPSIQNVVQWTTNAAKNFTHWISTTGTLAERFKGLMSILGQMAKLIFSVGKAFINAGVAVANFSGKMVDALKTDIEWVRKLGHVFGTARDAAGSAFGAIKGVVVDAGKAIVGVLAKIVRVVGAVINAFNSLKSAPGDLLGGAKDKLGDLAGNIPGLQKGGVLVGGSGTGDKVPAMLEPGEVVLNRNAVSALGGSQRANSINAAVPRFAGGGVIGGAVGQAGKAGAGLAAEAGMALLKAVAKAAAKGGGGATVQALLKEADRMSAMHQPYLLGGGHGGFSRSGPWDCSGAVSQVLHGAGMPISAPMVSGGFMSYGLPGLGQQGKTGIFANAEHVFMSINGKGYGTSAENPGGGFGGPLSYNSRSGFVKRHPELAAQMAGMGPNNKKGQPLKKGFQAGGVAGQISPHSPKHPAIGAQWIKDVGGNWDPNEIYTALRQLGADKGMAGFLSAVSVGESGGNPRAVGHDPGGTTGLGLLQMTTGVGNDSLIARYGGRAGMLNPWENMLAAMSLYRAGGPGNWFGHQGSRGHLLLDRIQGPTKVPKTKTKKPKPGAGGGSDWLADLLQSGEDRFAAASELADIQNTRIGSANELIGQGNFEALQRFQVGSAQAPILGLSKPGMPTPQSLIPEMEPWQFLNQVSAPTGSASPSISSVGVNNVTPQGDLMGGTLPKRGRRRKAAAVIHNHLYIDGKELDTRTRKVQRRTARGGHRPLPSRGGGL